MSPRGITLVLTLALAPGASGQFTAWSYDGAVNTAAPAAWAQVTGSVLGGGANMCAGSAQSPIDIPARANGFTLKTAASNPVDTFVTPVTGNYKISQVHEAPKFACAGTAGSCGTLMYPYNGVSSTWNLAQFHFHAPSEHTVNGIKFGLAAHLVHTLATDATKLLVFGVVFDGAAAIDSPVTSLVNRLMGNYANAAGVLIKNPNLSSPFASGTLFVVEDGMGGIKLSGSTTFSGPKTGSVDIRAGASCSATGATLFTAAYATDNTGVATVSAAAAGFTLSGANAVVGKVVVITDGSGFDLACAPLVGTVGLAATTGFAYNADLAPFVAAGSGHFNYAGSLTTPPCSEGVTWVVQATPLSLKQSQIDAFYQQVGGFPGTARPVQPLNSRVIKYAVDAPETFSYDGETGPLHWAQLNIANNMCGGSSQSPINIPARAAGFALKSSAAAPVESFVAPKAAALTVSRVHEAPKFACPAAGACGTLNFNGATWNFLQVHFHGPSEHTVDGGTFGLAAHLVHTLASDPTKLLVFGVVFTGGAAADTPVTQLVDNLFQNLGSTSGTTSAVDLSPFISVGSGVYTYTGSLTTPPCSEGVTWVVQATPLSLKQSQIDAFTHQLGPVYRNARPVQPLNNRVIKYAVDVGSGSDSYRYVYCDSGILVDLIIAVMVLSVVVFGAIIAAALYMLNKKYMLTKRAQPPLAPAAQGLEMKNRPDGIRLIANGLNAAEYEAIKAGRAPV